MPITQQFDCVEGMIIPTLDNSRCLIDSGCPISIGNQPLPSFGRTELTASLPGVTTDFVSESLGTPVQVLIGTDILGETPFLIDWPNQEITFSPLAENRPNPKLTIPLEMENGLPILNARIDGQEVRLGIDTGARQSFLTPRWLEHSEVVGEVPEWHFSCGPFQAPLHSKQIEIEGACLDLEIAAMPPTLSFPIEMMGLAGLIGNDLQKYFSKVLFDLPNLQLVFGD